MRRFAAFALAAVVSLPIVSPVAAADPSPPVAEPTPEVGPSPTRRRDAVAGADAPGDTRTGRDPDADASPEATLPAPVADPSPTASISKPAPPSVDSAGRPIATGRYIVMLADGTDPATVLTKHRQREGTRADRSFKNAFRGFTAKLDKAQRAALLADPKVVAVVPDEVIEIAAQSMPTGVPRVGATTSALAKINGLDERVDADVAIVDTGIGPHSDLNIAGGYNCSTADRTRWRDENGHGTHVAGTVGAKDNTWGVVGVAPGVRLWAVRILNSSGSGLLSWYVCGLDWILSQRDPNDASRPMIEAVNMSVAKAGSDDGNCGASNRDVLHAAICRLYTARITVVAAAANERRSAAGYVPAAYNQAITVSALADTDGKAGGSGGNRCYSWGSYDRDDTFADFSNYGSDVDLIAPGKCIWSTKPGPTYGYSSGTSMAAPHVTGAVALYKATRPLATPSEVRELLRYIGSSNWYRHTDPDNYHEPLLSVSRIGTLGTFSLAAGSTMSIPSKGGTATVPFSVSRSSTFFERVRLRVDSVPVGLERDARDAEPVWLDRRQRLGPGDCPVERQARHLSRPGERYELGSNEVGDADGQRRLGHADREGAHVVGLQVDDAWSIVHRLEQPDPADLLGCSHRPVRPDRRLRSREERQRRHVRLDGRDVGLIESGRVHRAVVRVDVPLPGACQGQRWLVERLA